MKIKKLIKIYRRRLFPLNVLHRKILYGIKAEILKRPEGKVKIYGFPLIVPFDVKGIGKTLQVYQERELDQYRIMQRVLQRSDTVMDIGGNFGYYASVELQIVGSDGFIYCFEPDPRNHNTLKKNLSMNAPSGNYEIITSPVSDSEQHVNFFLADESNLSSINLSKAPESPVLASRYMNKRKYIGSVETRTVEFCKFVEQVERKIDLVRMDIEGHEVSILSSLANRLETDPNFYRAPGAFLFEPHSWEYSPSYSLIDALERLSKFGYKITFLGSRDEEKSPFLQYGYRPTEIVREKRGVVRGVYTNLNQEDARHLAASVDGVTTVCLQRLL